ncbi:MAG: hypothetical protein ACXWVJ_00100 [Caulobacteraceae bacterium]
MNTPSSETRTAPRTLDDKLQRIARKISRLEGRPESAEKLVQLKAREEKLRGQLARQ